MGQIIGYNYVVLIVDDLDRAVSFYKDVFELKQIPRPDSRIPWRGAWFQVGDAVLHTLEKTKPPTPSPERHISLKVANFEALLKDLQQKNIPIVEGPGERGDGTKYLRVRDPEGNLFELKTSLS